MHDGPVGTRAGDRREADVAQRIGLSSELLELLDRCDFVKRAARSRAIEPREKTGQRRAVAQMRSARAGDFGVSLDRFRQDARISGARDRFRAQSRFKPRRRGVWIEPHARLTSLECLESGSQRRRRQKFRNGRQMRLRLPRDFLLRDEEFCFPLGRHDRERQSDRCVGDVAAANIEKPRDAVRHGQDNRMLTVVLQPLLNVGDFVGRRLSRKLEGMRGDGRRRRYWPRLAPCGVDQVSRQRLQFHTARRQVCRKALSF